MQGKRTIYSPGAFWRFLRERLYRLNPNLKGAFAFPPGHFGSPLLDLKKHGTAIPFDGPEWWSHIDLRAEKQRAYYEQLFNRFAPLAFPQQRSSEYRYFAKNDWFPLGDAVVLSGIIRKERPRRIVEVGSGYSSAVMLDTAPHCSPSLELTFIEPNPERLRELIRPRDNATVITELVQDVPLELFELLEANDILFIDSSHVAKIGSDVTFLLLRVLPRLKRGVWVHFHDIFYPFSYPAAWIGAGWAYNESLFLRAFLVGNCAFEIVAFNHFAAGRFPDLFRDNYPAFLSNPGGSFWIRKVA